MDVPMLSNYPPTPVAVIRRQEIALTVMYHQEEGGLL